MKSEAAEMISVGSLFSGIGGLELGLERTGGFKTIWQCENNEYASAVLRKHWPQVPNLGDIEKVDWNEVEKPRLVCGGFPCQDISVAGRGKGIKEGARSGLWFEFHKAIRILRPDYALVENVSALSQRGLDIVLAGLAEIGYDAEWFTLSAAEVGAPHKRERLFIVAYNPSVRRRQGTGDWQERQVLQAQIRQVEESKPKGNRRQLGPDENFNINENGYERISRLVQGKIRRFPEFSWYTNIGGFENLFTRADILEPLFCGSRDGVPNWVDRIKCLGNAVVPQVAQVIGEAILDFDEAT